MTDAARMITCAACGGCLLKIGRAADTAPRLVPCPMCGHGRVLSAPMDEEIAVHRFDGDGGYVGRMRVPGDDSGWKEEYGYPPPSELFKGRRRSW